MSKGVGVSANNLRWFAIGTANRFTGSKRVRGKFGRYLKTRVPTGNRIRFTGRINERLWGGFVQKGSAAAKGPALDAAKKRMADMIAKEAAAAKGAS